MRVKELIDLLLSENPDRRVVVDGYEEGFDELEKIQHICITPNPDKVGNPEKHWWLGEFEECIQAEGEETAILLPRKKRNDYYVS